jgi:hypothetical protein
MTENVIVSIIENHENSSGNSEEKLLSNIDSMENLINNTSLYDSEDNENNENNENNEDTTMAIQIEYELNYTVKQLKSISEYYNIDTRKLKKSEIIDNIILFEMEDENQSIIYTRKRLWYFVEELKNDHFFDNIIFPF